MIALVLALLVPQAVATPSPLPSAMNGVTPIALPSSATTPAPAGTPVYGYVWHPPQSANATPFPDPDTPQIDEIDATARDLVVPGPFHVRVLTNDAVTSVTATAYGYGVILPMHAAGVFAFDGDLPAVPDNAKNKIFNIDVTAQSKSGRTVTYTLSFTLK